MTVQRTPGARRFSLPRFALTHPHATIVLALVMVILGVYAYIAIPVRMIPKVPSPDVGVITQFPGMSAEDMQRYITAPLEKRIQIVGGVNYVLGTSQAGYSKIVVYFNYDVNLEKKWLQMQALLNEISNELPKAGPNTTKPRLVHVNNQNGPAIQFAITRPGMSLTALTSMVNNIILTQFQQQPGVLSAYTFGGQTRQIRIDVDRNKLAAYGLNILAIRKAIDAANFNHGGDPSSTAASASMSKSTTNLQSRKLCNDCGISPWVMWAAESCTCAMLPRSGTRMRRFMGISTSTANARSGSASRVKVTAII